MTTAREELLQEIEDLCPAYVSADYLRGVEDWFEELIDLHGPHPVLVAAIKRISKRIIAIELGEGAKEK